MIMSIGFSCMVVSVGCRLPQTTTQDLDVIIAHVHRRRNLAAYIETNIVRLSDWFDNKGHFFRQYGGLKNTVSTFVWLLE